MATPKIKMYLLDKSYGSDADTDLQYVTNDELLPVVPKPKVIWNMQTRTATTTPLVGVAPVEDYDCQPFDPNSPRTDDVFLVRANAYTDPAEDYYVPDGVPMSALLLVPSGELEYRIFARATNKRLYLYPADPSGFTVATDPDSGDIVGFRIPAPPSGGTKISYMSRGATPSQYWALPYDDAYDGTNETCNRVVVNWPGGGPAALEPSGTRRSYIMLPAPAASGVRVNYWYRTVKAMYFAGPDSNWIGDHYLMWPDLFVGTYDYPGDARWDEQQQTYVPTPAIPKYRAWGTYSMRFRDGVAVFTEVIDSAATPVSALYARLAGIRNVNNMVLEQDLTVDPSGLFWRAVNEGVFPEAHGRPWVSRSDDYTPVRIRVDGVTTPQAINMPYEVLDQK